MHAVTRRAGDRMQVISRGLGRCPGQQALNSITGIGTREENGAPNPWVCHLHASDETETL